MVSNNGGTNQKAFEKSLEFFERLAADLYNHHGAIVTNPLAGLEVETHQDILEAPSLVKRLLPRFLDIKAVKGALQAIEARVQDYSDTVEAMPRPIKRALENNDLFIEKKLDDSVYKKMMDVFAESPFARFMPAIGDMSRLEIANGIVSVRAKWIHDRPTYILQTDKTQEGLDNYDARDLAIDRARAHPESVTIDRYVNSISLGDGRTMLVGDPVYLERDETSGSVYNELNRILTDRNDGIFTIVEGGLSSKYNKWNGERITSAVKRASEKVRSMCEASPQRTNEYGAEAVGTALGFVYLAQRLSGMLKRYSADHKPPRIVISALEYLESATQSLDLSRSNDVVYLSVVNSIQETGTMIGQALAEYQKQKQDEDYRERFLSMLDSRLGSIASGLHRIAEKNFRIQVNVPAPVVHSIVNLSGQGAPSRF